MRGRVLSLTGGLRLIAYGLVALALVLATLHLRHAGRHPAKPSPAPMRAPIDELLHELTRCRDSGTAAQDDKACIAAWEENRRRFFEGGHLQ